MHKCQDILGNHGGYCASAQNEALKGHNFPVRGQKQEKDLYMSQAIFSS